jgi:hypothetical protein
MMSLSRPDFHVTAMSHFSVLASHFIFFGEFSDFEGYASVSVFDLFKVCTLCPVPGFSSVGGLFRQGMLMVSRSSPRDSSSRDVSDFSQWIALLRSVLTVPLFSAFSIWIFNFAF